MIFIATASLTLLIVLLLDWRRAVEERAIRWELYAKRDELRRLALEDKSLLDSDIFESLDRSLTYHCATIDSLSLWTILPRLMLVDRQKVEGRHKNFETKLHQPKNRAMIPIYEGVVPLFARHLMWRHMILTAFGLVTLVGIVVCAAVPKWLAERVVSDAVRPIPVPGEHHPRAALAS